MNQLTKEQRFWEQCGFCKYSSGGLWHYGDSIWHCLPPINLNNLFRHCMPKLQPTDVHFKLEVAYPEHTISEIHCWLYFKGKKYTGWSYDPALALLGAVQEVIHGR